MATEQRTYKRLKETRRLAKKVAPEKSFESESEDEEIEWIGEPLNKETFLRRKPIDRDKNHSIADSHSSGLERIPLRRATRGSGFSNIPYYGGFKKGRTTYFLGDTVLLRNKQYSGKYEYPHVAQILELWETEDGGLEGNFRWFHQAEDIARLRKHQRKGNFPQQLEKGEIVYSLDDDKNEISTVIAKCQVLNERDWQQRLGQEQAKVQDHEESMVWFCRGLVKRMTGYHTMDWMGNNEMMALKEESVAQVNKTPSNDFSKTKQMPRKVIKSSSKHKMGTIKIDSASEEDSNEYQANASDEQSNESESENDNSRMKRKRGPAKKKAATVANVRKSAIISVSSKHTGSSTPQVPTTHRSISTIVPKTDFEFARNRLHVKAVPDSLPCREDEFMEIQEHLESALEEGTGSCIYISGVPGTGKTATVLEVIRSLQAKADIGEISPFQFVEINGMKVTEPSYAYVLLWMALSNQKVTANHALQLLEKQFSTPGPRRLPCVVLMDELDLLVTSKQTVMYNFFEWPNWQHSRLIVVAVANTMDLPERMLSNKVSSRLGLTRINFQPYTYQQLVTIVESRLEGIRAFKKEAIEFAARKVGAVSGDARRALDICRRAVEIVENNAQKLEEQRRRTSQKNPFLDLGPAPKPEQVTIRIVDQAIKEMFASPNVRLIQTASLHQKLFLVALTLRLRRLGLAEVEFSEIAHAHLQMCRLYNLELPMLSDLSAICASLGSSRCLLVESGKQDIHQRVRLSVSEEDVMMALKTDPLFKRALNTLSS
ncbi:Origin recognition complex, subunit 1 [Lobosporangium transversale]|uniref:Origin recognition complex subunit 1 n=1 Tax=Lobosporangium transversale TaxID=64571 RepID=A0A1Y2G6W9_9FUNG|nr:P-loop containing nucleoside triphosphate hydrolase protein [Lobosporangium transversale]KAF9919299.1 Origin recognition complex, subunit 1 [Lobosporangium transversale]ORY99522.1 P-loop containing nucleoside triphosphate hydrolase protein [Lobosporangium transversale]|eukprot:XP_021875848.1 P-loop containing nucleoside triphosphate hydrolase protein [Lobosporangium transversale]